MADIHTSSENKNPPLPEGTYRFRSLAQSHEPRGHELFLDLLHAEAKEGNRVIAYPGNKTRAQEWIVRKSEKEKGTYHIQSDVKGTSGHTMYLSIDTTGQEKGQAIISQHPCEFEIDTFGSQELKFLVRPPRDPKEVKALRVDLRAHDVIPNGKPVDVVPNRQGERDTVWTFEKVSKQ